MPKALVQPSKYPNPCKPYVFPLVAPIKALCTERTEDWTARLGPLGLKCKELTGDTELDDYYDLQAVHVILTTPVSQHSLTDREQISDFTLSD